MKKYDRYITELIRTNNDEQELFELANVTYKTTGIEDVIIWIGPNPTSHDKRIKISNIYTDFLDMQKEKQTKAEKKKYEDSISTNRCKSREPWS